MARYIDADKLIHHDIKDIHGDVLDVIYATEIDNAPTADVVSVKHGQWVYDPNRIDFGLGAWQCSICTSINHNLPCDPNINPYNFAGSKYCPHCGARMGGETK